MYHVFSSGAPCWRVGWCPGEGLGVITREIDSISRLLGQVSHIVGDELQTSFCSNVNTLFLLQVLSFLLIVFNAVWDIGCKLNKKHCSVGLAHDSRAKPQIKKKERINQEHPDVNNGLKSSERLVVIASDAAALGFNLWRRIIRLPAVCSVQCAHQFLEARLTGWVYPPPPASVSRLGNPPVPPSPAMSQW